MSQFAPVYREARKGLFVPCYVKSEKENLKKGWNIQHLVPKVKPKLLHNCKKGNRPYPEVNLAQKN